MNEFKVRKGLVINGSGSALLDVQGSVGQLTTITDSLSGSLFSVNDISGIPVLEAFSDGRIKIGEFGREAIKISGSFATTTGSLRGTASYATNALSASNALTSSYALSSSYAISSSFATTSSQALTASYVLVSSVVGLNLSQIASGSVTASVDPVYGFRVNSNSSITGSLRISGSVANSSSLAVIGTGSGVFTVDGTSGRLFSVDDSLSGSLFSVNTAAGLPVMEAFSDNTVRIGQYGKRALFVSQSVVGINKETALNGVLDISGSAVITGSLIVTGSTNVIGDVTGSNARFSGTITTQTLVVQTVSSSITYSSGSNIFGNLASNTQQFTGSVYISGSILNVNTSTATFSSLGTGTVSATAGTLSTTSDMTLKIEDGYINNALEKVLNLKPRYFHWKEESGLPTDIRQLGFYAQEVNAALGEETANTPRNETDKWGIYDRGIVAFLTKALQELNQKFEDYKSTHP